MSVVIASGTTSSTSSPKFTFFELSSIGFPFTKSPPSLISLLILVLLNEGNSSTIK